MSQSVKPVRKAVIAAAGFGTRFLPQTKAMPKEMLPLVDKPIVQYIVEELVGAGIEDIIIVTGYHKRSIEDHFDEMSTDLRHNLDKPGKEELLKQTEGISDLANFIYVRQKGPYGNATPVLNAEHLVSDEPFIYTFADDFFVAKPSRFQQMITKYQQTGSSVLPCMRIKDDANYKKYGVVAGHQIEPGVIDMKTIIEKPGKEDAPSDLASVTGYLLTPDIFPYLREAKAELEAGKEFIIQTAMQKMIQDNHQMLALEIKNGHYYDTGNKLDYVKTLVDFALRHDDIKEEFAEYLKQLRVQ
jgi:UTP--glucose-1-phosphate uridylyltransferase